MLSVALQKAAFNGSSAAHAEGYDLAHRGRFGFA